MRNAVRHAIMARPVVSAPDHAALWATAVVANGGSVSEGRLAIINAFIADEKADDRWLLTDDYIGLWAENAAQALTSLKQRRLAVPTAAPTFTADRGYVFNGSTQFIDTGFVPSVHANAMFVSSSHIEAYERTNVSANTTTAGATSTTSRNLVVRPRNGGTALGGGVSALATYTLPAATSAGLTQVGRAGTLATDAYGSKNGVAMARTVDPSAVGVSLPAHSIYIGGTNSAGALSAARACSAGYVAWGAALTAAQRLARYGSVQVWATAVGAQV